MPWKDVPAWTTTQRGHGHRATRTIKVLQTPRWIEFDDTTQVAQLRRTVTTAGKKSVEVCYVITSADAPAAEPATLAAWVQGHWAVEDRLHWVRDVTFDEDPSTPSSPHDITTDHSPTKPRMPEPWGGVGENNDGSES